VQRDEALRRLRALGASERDAEVLWRHFDDAEQRGKLGHGHSRIAWLETQDFDMAGLGYLVLDRVVEEAIREPPAEPRLVVLDRCFPTGMLGHYTRRLAEAGLVSLLTATSPARLGPPGGPKLAGTNPLSIGVPGDPPVVVDVSMGAVTWGDVIAGLADEERLVPFGGEQWHKAFALALGLQLFVDALVSEPGHGAVLLVACPEADPVPAVRAAAAGVRLPGDAGDRNLV
jgi:LDH2 family malate/lactate/ureidoglycolate dehydrogenase